MKSQTRYKLSHNKIMVKMRFIYIIPLILVIGNCVDHPYEVQCPEYPLIRQGYGKLSSEEATYVKQKSPFTRQRLFDYLGGFSNSSTFLDPEISRSIWESPPIIGLSISGGGYRSMLTATGMIQEMNSVGLFDPLTYISGLSGGSWVLLDLILHGYDPETLLEFWNLETGILEGIPNFDIETQDIIDDMSGEHNQTLQMKRHVKINSVHNSCTIAKSPMRFLKKRGLFPFVGSIKKKIKPGLVGNKPSKKANESKLLTKISEFYLNIHFKVRHKKLAGFPLCFTDYWGRALLQRATDKSKLLKTTSLYDLINRNARFIRREAPIPIFIANCRNKGMKNFIFEFTPFEFGSWETSGQIFVKLKYLGSHIRNGVSEKCYRNFDDIGFITATSSSIFNNVVAFVWTKISQASTTIVTTFSHFAKIFGMNNMNEVLEVNNQYTEGSSSRMETDYAIYRPNPFFQYNNSNITTSITTDNFLYLVDGGEDGENIPLRNLMVPARAVETIFIIDSSSDNHNYANGTKLLNVLERMRSDGIEYFQNGNYSLFLESKTKPVVMGCSMKVITSSEKIPPILIYYQNREINFPSNMSTFKATYSKDESSGMLQNGRAIFHGENTVNNLTLDKCLPCFILKRRLDSVFYDKEYPRSYKSCDKCFETFCIS